LNTDTSSLLWSCDFRHIANIVEDWDTCTFPLIYVIVRNVHSRKNSTWGNGFAGRTLDLPWTENHTCSRKRETQVNQSHSLTWSGVMRENSYD